MSFWRALGVSRWLISAAAALQKWKAYPAEFSVVKPPDRHPTSGASFFPVVASHVFGGRDRRPRRPRLAASGGFGAWCRMHPIHTIHTIHTIHGFQVKANIGCPSFIVFMAPLKGRGWQPLAGFGGILQLLGRRTPPMLLPSCSITALWSNLCRKKLRIPHTDYIFQRFPEYIITCWYHRWPPLEFPERHRSPGKTPAFETHWPPKSQVERLQGQNTF